MDLLENIKNEIEHLKKEVKSYGRVVRDDIIDVIGRIENGKNTYDHVSNAYEQYSRNIAKLISLQRLLEEFENKND